MDSPPPDARRPPAARWRWWLGIAAMLVLAAVAGLFAGLPWMLSSPAGRRLLKARADAILAPASVEFDAIRLSWSRPTEIDGVVLRDRRGSAVLTAKRADFPWSLRQILFARPKKLTLSFPEGVLDVERQADGKVNLHEALEPILRDKPEREIVIKIEGGRLTFRDPAFPEPVVASRVDIVLDIEADPGPVSWRVLMMHETDGLEAGRLDVRGSYTRPSDAASGPGDTTITVRAMQWPWTLAVAGVAARGKLDATIQAGHFAGRLACSGSISVSELAAGQAMRLDWVRLDWEVEGGKDLWTARRLELSAPIRSIAGIEGSPDGAPRGDWLEGDLRVVADATYAPPSDRLAIGGFTATTPYGRLDGSGTVDRMKATPRLDMKGSLDPDWSWVRSLLVREVEPNARIAGRSRAWALSGPVDALRGELGVQLDGLDVFGMRLGETAVVVRAEDGRLGVDPIEARLNEGRLHLEPRLARGRDGSYRVELGPTSTLENAVVNDEVSHRVLSYAAPVLDGATRVQGRVSLKRVDAAIPLFAAEGEHARVEGDVLFDDVRFMPGPLAEDLISLFPNADADADRPLLVLRDPVSLRITEGKVYQHGLKFPLGRVGAVALEGSVDFRKNLDLVARFTLNPPLAADKPVLASILRTARLELPIRGTLQDPRIDPQAMQDRLKDVGADLLENSVGIGAEGVLRLLQGLAARRQARLADPDRPPPMTPAERRELREGRRRERLEKKAERRPGGDRR